MAVRFFHKYKKDFGASQYDLVKLYYKLGKSLDEMEELLKPIPRSSIRGRISEIRLNERLVNDALAGMPQIEN